MRCGPGAFIANVHHLQQKGTEDDKIIPGPSSRTTGTGRAEDLLWDWYEKIPVNKFLHYLQIVELLQGFTLLPGFEKMAFFHWCAPGLHPKGNDLLCEASESQQ